MGVRGCGGQRRAGYQKGVWVSVGGDLWGDSGNICRQSIRNTCRDQASSQVLGGAAWQYRLRDSGSGREFHAFIPSGSIPDSVVWLSLSTE
jgi:hypothetical protein